MIKFLIPYFIFLAYTISYPVQVFSLGHTSGIFGIFIAISLGLIIFQTLATKNSLNINKRAVLTLTLLSTLPIFYLLPYLENQDKYFSATFTKTAVLYLLLAAITNPRIKDFFYIENSESISNKYQPKILASWLLFGLPMLVLLFAAFQNSMGSIPPGTTLSDKYFYGPFIRAGAGYVDPNALGIMVVLIFSVAFEYISRYRSLLIANCVITALLVLLTFSRTAQIIFIALVFFKIINFATKKAIATISTVVVATGIYLAYIDFELVSVLFERYYNEEGESSTSDRINQITVFLNMLALADLKSIFLGFGGQEAFQQVAGSAMHSAPLSAFIDSGVFPALAILIFFGINIVRAFHKPINGFRIIAIATSLVLPYIPELFFLLCIYLTLEDKIYKKPRKSIDTAGDSVHGKRA